MGIIFTLLIFENFIGRFFDFIWGNKEIRQRSYMEFWVMGGTGR